MSDGGEVGSETQRGNGERAPIRANAKDFSRAVSRIAMAQVCESLGFEGFNESALEALADIAVRYLVDLGKTADFYASLAGRTECNVFDVVQGLEDLGSSSGFLGASEVGHCLVGSSTVREIVEFVESAEEIPFAQPVLNFPVIRSRRVTPSFFQLGETPVSKHIPDWLPAFPDPHTYRHTPVWSERATDPRADKLELARQRRKAERSLLSLQRRLVSNGSGVDSTSADVINGGKVFASMDASSVLRGSTLTYENDEGKALQVVEAKNPFLAPPLKAGERSISPIPLPAKLSGVAVARSHVTIVDTFTPAIEAISGEVCNSEGMEKRVLPDKRPPVRLKLKTGKKVLGKSVDLSLQKKGFGKTAPWSTRDDEKDDKKRRAELILRQCMVNPLELTQL